MECNNYGVCQIEGCSRPAAYGIYHTNLKNKTKVFIYVCSAHERIIGDENEHRARNQNRGCSWQM
jgi:hypothetical protein